MSRENEPAYPGLRYGPVAKYDGFNTVLFCHFLFPVVCDNIILALGFHRLLWCIELPIRLSICLY